MLIAFAVAVALTAPIEVVYHADLEGRLVVPRCGEAGAPAPDYAAQVATIARLRVAATERGAGAPIALLGGDQIAPDLFARGIVKSSVGGARDMAAILGGATYDAITLGNHDLGIPRDRLEAFAGAATARGMPVVLSNLTCEAAATSLCRAVRPDVMIERGAQKIGVLAVLMPRALESIAKERRAGLALADPAPAITAGVKRLRAAGAGFVIVMIQSTANRSGMDEVLALQLALVKGDAPDLILSAGLSDVEGLHPTLLVRNAGSPPVIGSTTGTTGVTRVTVEPRDGQTWIDATVVPSIVDQRDPGVAAALEPHIAEYCTKYGKPIAPAGTKLPGTRAELLAYALEVMRRKTQSEIAITNNGFVYGRAFPLTGQLTRAKLKRAMPYTAVVGTVMVPGAALAGVLEKGEASKRLAMLGAARPEPGKSFEINGRPIDKARSYRIAVIDYIANGGDGVYGDEMKKWKPTAGQPDLRELVEAELAKATTYDTPASQRVLLVAIGDLAADFTNVSIRNPDGLEDAQLTRAQQQAVKLELSSVFLIDHPLHRDETKLSWKFGYARTRPAGEPAAAQETLDLIQITSLYSFRGLEKVSSHDAMPDPYSRLSFETELTVPDSRAYRHAEVTHSIGALWTLLKTKLKLRAGAGYRTELFADRDSLDPVESELAGFRFLAEAGATLDPVVLATRGPLAVTFEGNIDYFMLDPIDETEHQVRASGKLSLPLVPLLFLTAGLDVFFVDREGAGRGASFDTTVGLKLHLDGAYQAL